MAILLLLLLYKYYIPCAGDSRKYHPEECDYQPRRGDDIFDYHPRRECNIYFIIPNRTLDPLFSEVELLLLLNRPIMVRGEPKGK